MNLIATEDTFRTLLKAALQVIPIVGGVIAEITDLAPSGAQRRIQETLREVAKELARLGVSLTAVEERLANSEPAQVLIHDGVNAAMRTTSTTQRIQLGSLLAKGLTATELETTNINSLLVAWADLDDVEKLLFTEIAKGPTSQKILSARFPETFGRAYFGEGYVVHRFTEDMHRNRIDRLNQSRLIRPPAHLAEKWQKHELGYQFENFILSGRGEVLWDLLGETTFDADLQLS